MRLPLPFHQLPLLFDPARLQAEIAALPGTAWVPHPDRLPGNSAVRLISSGGGETDMACGSMRPTRWLEALPSLRELLASFGVVWGRSRLMRLAPGVGVPEHADIAHYWHHRVRVHLPITTSPKVLFHCGGETAHLAAGEAWLLDTWRRHRVENAAAMDRIHLVADTTGTANFWQIALADPLPRDRWQRIPLGRDQACALLTELNERSAVMPAAEVDLLAGSLCADLVAGGRTPAAYAAVGRFTALIDAFTQDWRQLCAVHGTTGRAAPDFLGLAERLRTAANLLGEGAVVCDNGVDARLVLAKRILDHLVAMPA